MNTVLAESDLKIGVGERPRLLLSFAYRCENIVAALALLLMALLPVAEFTLRSFFGLGVPGTYSYDQNLTLWVGFVGAAIATRQGRHLTLSTVALNRGTLPRDVLQTVAGIVALAVANGLCWGGRINSS